MRYIFCCLCLLLSFPARAETYGNVLSYSDISTNNMGISPEIFNEHIDFITNKNFVTLDNLLDKVYKASSEEDENLVSIIIDSPKKKIAETLCNKLLSTSKSKQYGFTLFLSASEVGKDGNLSWADLNELVKDCNVAIGVKNNILATSSDISEDTFIADINKNIKQVKENLGINPEYVMYKGGLASNNLKKAIKKLKFKAAFGLHSGAFYKGSDKYYLPAFSVTSAYSDMARIKTATTAHAFKAKDILPKTHIVKNNPPLYGFTLSGDDSLPNVSCYSSNQGALDVEQLGPRIEVRYAEPLPVDAAERVNCTSYKNGHWYWFGNIFYVAK